MNIKEKTIDKVTVIYIEGSVDANISSEVEVSVMEIIDNNPLNKIIINFSDVTYMSSPGISVLVTCIKKLGETGRKLILSNVNPLILKVLKTVELTDLIDMYNLEEEALRSIG
ncbi:STAS domain-containing protein [Spirochaetota bacterium]